MRGQMSVSITWSWRIEGPRSIKVGSWSTDAKIDRAIAALRGARISAVEIAGRLPELTLELDDGRAVRSFMTAEGQPQWAFFLRRDSWLEVERGGIVRRSSTGQ
jgi:hypothetical protein